MTLQEMNPFVRTDPFPSWIANALERFLSVAAPQFRVQRVDKTHIQIPAGAADQAAVLAIGGLWRWMETTVGPIAHPGGAAGVYPAFVTARNNNIVTTPLPFTDSTDYTFGLVIEAPGGTPAIVAGTVDVFRHVADVEWDGARITRVNQLVAPLPAGAARVAPLVTSLPSSPTDGDECCLLVDASNGVIWRLRYNAYSLSAYKWEFVGGSALASEVDANQSTTSGVFTDLTTVGPSVTLPVLPTGGDFEITFGADMQSLSTDTASVNAAQMSFAVGATPASTADMIEVLKDVPLTLGEASVARTRRKTGVAGGVPITAKYRTGTSAGFSMAAASRFLAVRPIRVG